MVGTSSKAEETQTNGIGPHLALIGVQACFGSLPVVGKTVLTVIPSVALVGFRIGIATLVFYVFQRRKGSIKLKQRSDYVRVAILGFVGVALNQFLFVGGLSLTKASNTSLLAATIPIFTLCIGAYAGIEKIVSTKVVGVLLAAAGVLILIDPRTASFSSETTLGDVMIILNSLAYGVYVIYSKDLLIRNGTLKTIVWVFIFASISSLPFAAYSLTSVDLTTVTPMIWLMVLYIAIAGTVAPYLLNAWALRRVAPSTVAVYIYLQPLIGFAFAVVFLNEKVDVKFIAAALFVFAGVYLTTKRRKRVPVNADQIQ